VKVLLDVCTPVHVRQALLGHEIHTAVKMGWGQLENGELLRVAESAGFDLFIVCDKNLRDSAKPCRPTPGHPRTLDKPSPNPGTTFCADSPEC
jgi:hypothetical protein